MNFIEIFIVIMYACWPRVFLCFLRSLSGSAWENCDFFTRLSFWKMDQFVINVHTYTAQGKPFPFPVSDTCT